MLFSIPRRRKRSPKREAESPPPPRVEEPKTQIQELEKTPEPPRTRPRSAKRRTRQKTVIQTSNAGVGEDVAVHSGTQTYDNGNQTDKNLLSQYNYVRDPS